jgi:hypothetical protein
MGTALADVLYAMRRFGRAPGFTAVAIVSLALHGSPFCPRFTASLSTSPSTNRSKTMPGLQEFFAHSRYRSMYLLAAARPKGQLDRESLGLELSERSVGGKFVYMIAWKTVRSLVFYCALSIAVAAETPTTEVQHRLPALASVFPQGANPGA